MNNTIFEYYVVFDWINILNLTGIFGRSTTQRINYIIHLEAYIFLDFIIIDQNASQLGAIHERWESKCCALENSHLTPIAMMMDDDVMARNSTREKKKRIYVEFRARIIFELDIVVVVVAAAAVAVTACTL